MAASNLPQTIVLPETTMAGAGGLAFEQIAGNVSATVTLAEIGAAQRFASSLPTLEFFASASKATGDIVKFSRDTACLPYLVGTDNEPVFLYQFVESIEESVDFTELRRANPTLTNRQIAGALMFLRKLSQFNVKGFDIDDLEASIVEASPEFQAMIRRALEDKEDERVLSVQHPNG